MTTTTSRNASAHDIVDTSVRLLTFRRDLPPDVRLTLPIKNFDVGCGTSLIRSVTEGNQGIHMISVILEQKNSLIMRMTQYMKHDSPTGLHAPNFKCGYTLEHIGKCAEILEIYLSSIFDKAASNREDVMEAVKAAVLSLNVLNENAGGCLIETSERDDICDILINAAQAAGLQTDDDDITEAWRTW